MASETPPYITTLTRNSFAIAAVPPGNGLEETLISALLPQITPAHNRAQVQLSQFRLWLAQNGLTPSFVKAAPTSKRVPNRNRRSSGAAYPWFRCVAPRLFCARFALKPTYNGVLGIFSIPSRSSR